MYVLREPRTNERTPLLTPNSKSQSQFSNYLYPLDGLNFSQWCSQICEIVGIVGISLILISGFIIGVYLLARDENLFASDGMDLDLVDHNVWSSIQKIPSPSLLHDSHVLYIVILQAGGETCSDMRTCIRIMRNLQIERWRHKRDEIPYNFLIGGDEQTYEGRGWNHESGFNFLPSQNLITIGLIGNYTSNQPTHGQMSSAFSLINELENRRKLHKSYRVFGLRNITISPVDGEALFDRIMKWQRFATLLHVL